MKEIRIALSPCRVEQLFNVNRFDVARGAKWEGEMTDMGIYPIRAFFRRISKECRFVVSPQRFRYTMATNMMKSPDRNIQAVKRLLEHSSLWSTFEYEISKKLNAKNPACANRRDYREPFYYNWVMVSLGETFQLHLRLLRVWTHFVPVRFSS
ncbi:MULTISPECIES: site-specific integrase [unclassified Serratia (in: enterobacteria)]|uniref:site-specific integrase n=1 Tax=unclassified Serratia (in: enterobacteria) TaxID=2647522 RepID=UPI0018AA589A|nr:MULTISPECIES: site-specific integrase [unclassified Serratia (in: enterobacteria)]